MLVIVFFAAFQATREWADLIALFAMGLLGIYMRRFGWSRPALLIGYFLAPRLEPTIYQAYQVYGMSFFGHPIVMVLVVLTALSIFAAWRFSPNRGKRYEEQSAHGASERAPQLVFLAIVLAAVLYALAASIELTWYGGVFIQIVGAVALLLLLPLAFQVMRAREPAGVLYDEERTLRGQVSAYHYIAWLLGMLGLIALVGFPIGCALFIFSFLQVKAGNAPIKHALMASTGILFLGTMSHFLTLRYPGGLLQAYLEMPWWLGG
jgi:hypothetical protein